MAMLIPRLWVAGLSFMAVAWAADDAQADFVCEVRYSAATSEGDFGSVAFRLTANANCGGTNRGNFRVCSQGADSNNPSCAAGTALLPEAPLIATFEALQRAAAADQFVTVTTGACQIGSGTNCVLSLTFGSN